MAGYFEFTKWEIAWEVFRFIGIMAALIVLCGLMWLACCCDRDRPLPGTQEREVKALERPLETATRVICIHIYDPDPLWLLFLEWEQLEALGDLP